MPYVTPEQLSAFRHEQLYGEDLPLLAEPFRMLEAIPGDSFEQRELKLLERLPRNLGYYYLIFRFEGLWGNGGMQSVALGRDRTANQRLLEITGEAFQHFGAQAAASLIREFTPIAIQADAESDALLARDAPDEEFEPIWSRLDAFDSRYDSASSEFDHYQSMLDDIHQYAMRWQIE